ncbi:MAG: hypothetical protein J5748_03225 [Bacteroidales bacterium]|nr:hypothetical protein [Bacteroidales bacterium]
MSPSVSIRLNPFKGCAGPEGTPVPWSPYGRMLAERPVFTLDPLLHAGCYYVQDSSAMYVGHIFRKALERLKAPGIRVLDLCAAPGGKTTDIAASLREALGDGFLLVANEVMRDRSRILSDNVAMWGDPNVMVTSVDPVAFAQFAGAFDIIVADVPCSGEGMFRKDPRAVEEWSEQNVQLCAARQKRILADVWPALRPGGILVYSTCTYEDAENDDNLEWAASELGGSIIPPEDEFPQYGVRLTRHGNLLRAGEVPGEGQWVGSLIKSGESTPSRKADFAKLHPLRAGVPSGVEKGGKLIPDPDYALSLAFRGEYPVIELTRQQALEYLHHDPLRFPDAPRGFCCVAFEGHPLGFVNNLGTRCNTLHPLARRILMNI